VCIRVSNVNASTLRDYSKPPNSNIMNTAIHIHDKSILGVEIHMSADMV